MSFRLKLKYLLVHQLKISNREAGQWLESGRVQVNGRVVVENSIVQDNDEVRAGELLVRAGRQYRYYACYKPPGIESTFSPKIPDNLGTVFPMPGPLFVAGRLDKASEGLLLLSDDGKYVESLTQPLAEKEKEYLVEVDKPFGRAEAQRMEQGITIMGYTTLPCTVSLLSTTSFLIILTEGKNRQIRRMCYKLGYEVLGLKRIRIDKIELGELRPGEYREYAPNRPA